MEKRNRRPFGENGLREVSSVEYQMPDGNWTLVFEGVEFIEIGDGEFKQTPNAPVWSSEEEARTWLAGGSDKN